MRCTCSEGLRSSHSTALLVMAIKLDFPTVWLQFMQVSSYTHTQLASVGIAGQACILIAIDEGTTPRMGDVQYILVTCAYT